MLYSSAVKTTYNVTQAQSQLPRLLRQCESGLTITITRHDDTVAYLVARDRLEAILETLEIMANPKAMQAIRDYEAGKLTFKPLATLDEGTR